MKMYRKSDLTIINGMLVSESTGDVIVPASAIVVQANELETLAQKTKYLIAQPDATPEPSLKGFERKSIKDTDEARFNVDTPYLDYKAYETMMMLDEMDDVNVVNKANELLKDFSDLLTFVKSDYVVDCGGDFATFDTPTLGSVLDFTVESVMEVVAMTCGMEQKKDEDKSEKRHLYESDLSDEEKKMLLNIIANHDEEAAKILSEDGSVSAKIFQVEDDVEE